MGTTSKFQVECALCLLIREAEWARACASVCVLTSPAPEMARAGLGQRWGPGTQSRSPAWVQRADCLSHHHWLPGPVLGSWSWGSVVGIKLRDSDKGHKWRKLLVQMPASWLVLFSVKLKTEVNAWKLRQQAELKTSFWRGRWNYRVKWVSWKK